MAIPAVLAGLSVASSALGAIGAYQQGQASNRAATRNYEYQNKVREREWYQTLSIWGTKRTQFSRDIDESNIAAQTAYSSAQTSLNRSWQSAILQNEQDVIDSLKAEGEIEASAAERGVGGSSIRRLVGSNMAILGRRQAMRTRFLTESEERFKSSNESIRRALKGRQNKLYSQVAIQPTPDLTPPAPVLQNNTFGLLAGLAGAAVDGFSTHQQMGGKNPFTKGTGNDYWTN